MLVTRWQPNFFNQLHQLHNHMHELFENVSPNRLAGRPLAHSYPPLNVWEDATHFHVEAELPGLDLEKLEIYIAEGNQLTIQGERQPNEAAPGTWHRRERGLGKFSRTISLPAPVNADRVEARLEQGVLQITLPKSEQGKPKKIVVKSDV